MITKDFLAPLMDAWVLNWGRMPDRLRSIKALAQSLITQGTIFTPIEDREWICASPNTSITILGNGESSKLRKIIKEQMDISDLIRVTAIVPVDVTEYTAYLKEIGFKQEGTLRKFMIYNGEITDAHVLGFLLTDKRGRRRARAQ